MNLTIEQLSKVTNLSVSTVRVYASQRNLGKKVGNKKIFSQAEVRILLKGSKNALQARFQEAGQESPQGCRSQD